MTISRTVLALSVLGAAVVGLMIGMLSRPCAVCKHADGRWTKEADESISDRLINEMRAQEIRKHLKKLSSRPHLAGTDGELAVAKYIRDTWIEQGLTSVKLTPYQVLLSYPNSDHVNRIVLYGGNGEALHTSQLREEILRPEQNQSGVVPPFNAFSASGTPKGDLVYVNYGRVEDFDFLLKEKSMDITGKICIARYGKIFRGDKAANAERFGAAGLILYSDPSDYSRGHRGSNYPQTWWLPGTGVQRGSLLLEKDTLTPGYPGIDSAYHVPREKWNLPGIPVHPIGYDDATIFLRNLRGEEAPESWKGDLNITYKLGPGFTDPQSKIQMFVSTRNENRTTHNVFAFIEGAVEPDRYILLGNHHDAWVFGAVDPSSGTATMLEVSRAMAEMVKRGWRPRRTIIFCAWGAEEEGLNGSTEWVENFGHILGTRAVAYLNVDIAVQGNFSFRGRALPLLFRPLHEAAKKIPNPSHEEVSAGRTTVYDTWVEKGDNDEQTGKPRIAVLGSGSDFAPFVGKIGVTSADLRYNFDERLQLSSYPLYHSVYETFHLVDDIMDSTYAFHIATAQLWAELARHLADSLVLPFDVIAYGAAICRYTDEIVHTYGSLMTQNGLSIGLDYLKVAAQKFNSSATAFQTAAENIDRRNPVAVRMLNDQMMQLERSFIDPQALPDRPGIRHVVFAPSVHNSYSGSTFPALVDSMYDIENAANQTQRWDDVRKQLSIITFFIETAAASLKMPTAF